jgi:hypothetical protein
MPSRLSPTLQEQARRFIQADGSTFVEVWRGQTRVAAFQTRIAIVSSAALGRDVQRVQGNAAHTFRVMNVPTEVTLRTDDEVWDGSARYRVVSLDIVPNGSQALLRAV